MVVQQTNKWSAHCLGMGVCKGASAFPECWSQGEPEPSLVANCCKLLHSHSLNQLQHKLTWQEEHPIYLQTATEPQAMSIIRYYKLIKKIFHGYFCQLLHSQLPIFPAVTLPFPSAARPVSSIPSPSFPVLLFTSLLSLIYFSEKVSKMLCRHLLLLFDVAVDGCFIFS